MNGVYTKEQPARPRAFIWSTVTLTSDVVQRLTLIFSPFSKYAGKDATEEYSQVHAPDVVTENLSPKQQLGALASPSTANNGAPSAQSLVGTTDQQLAGRELTAAEMKRRLRMMDRPPLSTVLSLHDFEAVARQVMEERGWA